MTWEHKNKVAIAGIGFSAIERQSSTPLGEHAMVAARAAIDDAGLQLTDIDGLATYPTAPFAGAKNQDGEDVITPEFFLTGAQFGDIAWYSQAGAGLVASAMRDATNALIADACNYALVWRAMYVPLGAYVRVPTSHFGGDAQFTAPYGISSPIQWHALAYRRYMELYDTDRDSMGQFVVNSRNNANKNKHAYFSDKTLSHEEYLVGRMISDPICLFDCDIPVTACVAVVMTTAERARDLQNPPAMIAAIGQQTVTRPPLLRYIMNDHIESGKPLADQLWRDSGLGPADMSAAQLYDGFSPSTYYWLEAAGFCGRGEAYEFVRDGRIEIDGEMPLNTFGGSLSQGRLHGMGHIIAAALQVTDRAGVRQVKDAESVVVMDGSPMLRGGGLIVVRDS